MTWYTNLDLRSPTCLRLCQSVASRLLRWQQAATRLLDSFQIVDQFIYEVLPMFSPISSSEKSQNELLS